MRRIVVPLTTLLVIAVLSYGSGQILAHGDGGGVSVAQRVAERFNLNEEEVEALFEEIREEKKQGHQAMFEAMIDEAAEAGKITEEQRRLIIDKFDELRSTEGGVQNHLETRRELETWAEANGIDLSILVPERGHHHMMFGRLKS